MKPAPDLTEEEHLCAGCGCVVNESTDDVKHCPECGEIMCSDCGDDESLCDDCAFDELSEMC